MRSSRVARLFFFVLQLLKQFLDRGYEPVWVLLNHGSLANFFPTFFGFASQRGSPPKLALGFDV